ncbi:MAG: hypothetical protein GXP25_19970 [Planctomycetes bacterium]|nr:hypothetical protein [Planctomycetota bacterium]
MKKTKALLHLTGRTELLLTEWVPIGPNNFSFLCDRLECGTRGAECVLTSETDPGRNAAVVGIRGDETLTLKVVEFEDMDFIRFEARPCYDTPGRERKEKVIGVDLGRNGRVTYGMRLLPHNGDPDRYSVDDLTLIAADLVTDTSRTMDALVNAYQRQMLDVIYGRETVQRDQFLVVQAQAMEPAPASVQALLDNAAHRAELQQILGTIHDRRCFDAGDGGLLLSGSRGILLISPTPETYARLVAFAALMGCINSLQDNILSKIWRSWDVLNDEKKLIRTEGVAKIEHIQGVLSSLTADKNVIGAVPICLQQTLAEAEAFYQSESTSGDASVIELMQKLAIGRSLQKVRDRLADTSRVIDDFGTEIENVRLLASTLAQKETAGINRAMNILTVVSVIILPLTLITGWYGMNFQRFSPSDGREIGFWNMPELYWPYSYLVCIAVVVLIAISLSFFFHRQGLLFRRRRVRVGEEDSLIED